MRSLLSAVLVFGLLLTPHFSFQTQAQEKNKKRIILIAGEKTHGPENNGIHDYPWMIRYFKAALENSNIRDEVEVETHFNSWPVDSDTLKTADTIFIMSDGRNGDKGIEAPHLANLQRIHLMDQLIENGVGLGVIHYSTFAPDKYSERILNWVGGYFDWEKDGKVDWYSQIKTMETLVRPVGNHELNNGVGPFTLNEEYYFDIRFPNEDNNNNWMATMEAPALPSKKKSGNVVSWAVERKNGGRGFGTTCGHFYQNFQTKEYRKFLLNAIAWTAQIPLPDEGVVAPYMSMEEVQNHLDNEVSVERDVVETADETVYEDEPYWYKPGHPINPTEVAGLKSIPGFSVQKVFDVPKNMGSLTAITVDNKARLIVAAQHKQGIYRLTFRGKDKLDVEKLGFAAEDFGWSHGLLYAFNSLYVTVAEGNNTVPTGIHRLIDENNDGQFEDSELILEIDSSGEHGAHNIVVGPNREYLYFMCGNGSPVPDSIEKRRTVTTEGFDHILSHGYESSQHTYAGWVARFKPDGSDWELFASGLRNSYDLAFNSNGDLFTFDSDMEWDLGAPWYRPTRICHVVSGADFGWRGGQAKWPEYYEDSVPAVINIGQGSPTGLTFGYETNFPKKYRDALYACDWTFGTIHAIHLEPIGGGYKATAEEFIGGSGFPVTDLAVGNDGAVYITVGGRRLLSAIYKVSYDPSVAIKTERAPSIVPGELHGIRQSLEEYHGKLNDGATDMAWKYLAHSDRSIRYAARVALESQPFEKWKDKVLNEKDVRKRLFATLAFVRQAPPRMMAYAVKELISESLGNETEAEILTGLRAIELALARGEDYLDPIRDGLVDYLKELFPSNNQKVNRELVRLLLNMNEFSIVPDILDLMEKDKGSRPKLGSDYFLRNPKYGKAVEDILVSAPLVDRMHYAQMLTSVRDEWDREDWKRYMSLCHDAMDNSQGGHLYLEIWEQILNIVKESSPEEWLEELESSFDKKDIQQTKDSGPQPKGPGKRWQVEEVVNAVKSDFTGRDFINGKAMFEATQCHLCHQIGGVGGAQGPELSSLGRRFTIQDIAEAIIHPSKAISDQYMMTIIETLDGNALTGRMISKDNKVIRLATDLMAPSYSEEIPVKSIVKESKVHVSIMPSRLINTLNKDELLDLMAYLVSGADKDHPVFKK